MTTTTAHHNEPARDLPPQYHPEQVEARLYERWVAAGYFTADATSDRPPYCIVLPPPNVTGSLHIGSAFGHTLMDALTRRRRMQGYESLWLPGMDHASIATEALVERQLAEEGTSKRELTREEFVARVWQWKEEYGGRILAQMRRLGEGVDWSRERFTMDEGLSRAVQTIFKRLYDDGLIYRAERIINWCPRCQTALSDVEVNHEEDEGELVSIRYGEGQTSVVVATARVETMLGDTAVAVHPDDERYRGLVGKEIELPLTGRRIPIVADDHADPEFGTGAVKVTPAHDPNDFEIGRRHGLPMISIMDERGVVTAPGPFEGLDRFEARPAVKAALREDGRVVAEKRPYVHAVGHCDRCDTVVEPRLSMQWFVRVAPLAKAAGEAVRDGRVAIHPPALAARYFEWVDNMHDWCISRQLWWGHRIPVWHGPGGEMMCVGPGEQPPPGDGWRQDPDVLDTWFSSGLWPFSTLGWPDDTADLRRFYPTSVLVTGYDIIFFWVARMMMFGLYAMDGVEPFETVVLHGLVRDQYGQKMSKSKGNTVDPLTWMDRHGSDALRFTFARGANPGQDVPISEEWVQGSRNFCNKIWNATRFALQNGAATAQPLPPSDRLRVADRWVLSRLHQVIGEVDALYEDFEFAKVADTLYHFAWGEVCDWYVELAKIPLGHGGEEADATRLVLGHVLDAVLRMLHPLVPYVTEELWTALTGQESIVIAAWPAADPSYDDVGAEEEIRDLQGVVKEIRRFRAEQRTPSGRRLPAVLEGLAESPLRASEEEIRRFAGLRDPGEGFSATASVTAGGLRVAFDLSGTIDADKERARLDKALTAARKEVEQAERKLSNPDFLDKAPEEVVEQARTRRDQAEADIARVRGQLDALPPA